MSARRSAMSWVKHSRPAIIAAGIGLLVTFAASYAVGRWENRVASAEFVGAAKNQATLLQNGINEYRQRLMALRALFESFNEAITRSEFEFFSDRLFAEHPGILRINWIPRVKRRQRIEFENSARSDGIVGYHFQSVPCERRSCAGPRGDEYFRCSAQLDRDVISYGIDLASDAASTANALEGARDNDIMAVCGYRTARIFWRIKECRLCLCQSASRALHAMSVSIGAQPCWIHCR